MSSSETEEGKGSLLATVATSRAMERNCSAGFYGDVFPGLTGGRALCMPSDSVSGSLFPAIIAARQV